MAVSEHDVRHVAALARLGLDEARVPALVAELNGILVHMDALQRVKTDGAPVTGVGVGGMPLRVDAGPQYPLAHPRAEIAPAMRAGFYLVPRLATHTGLAATESDAPHGGRSADGSSRTDSSVDDAAAADALALDGTDA